MSKLSLGKEYRRCLAAQPERPLAACPDFSSCAPSLNLLHSHYACRSNVFHSMPESTPPAASTCPSPSNPSEDESVGIPLAVPNPACLRRGHHAVQPTERALSAQAWADESSLHVFLLRDVFVEERGVTFDAHTIFSREGCIRDDKELFFPEGSLALHVPGRSLSLLYFHSINFYHSMVDMLPLFLPVAHFLRAQPNMPIFFTHIQWNMYKELGVKVVGIPAKELNVICVHNQGGLLLAQELLQPVFPECGFPSVEFVFELRRRFFLPPDGLPFFSPGWVPRGQNPLSLEDMAAVPDDWLVVLGRRLGRGRTLYKSVENKILQSLLDHFGQQRVVAFNGTLGVLGAKELFNRAMLFVATHGAGLTNMVFMPMRSFVWEFRPQGFPVECYANLARACGIHHVLTWGEGSKDTMLQLDLAKVLRALADIARNMTLEGIQW